MILVLKELSTNLIYVYNYFYSTYRNELFLSEDKTLIDEYCGSNFNQWLIVSQVTFTNESLKAYDVCEVSVSKCEGHVCPRCWNITASEAEDGLCKRCASVL